MLTIAKNFNHDIVFVIIRDMETNIKSVFLTLKRLKVLDKVYPSEIMYQTRGGQGSRCVNSRQ